MSRRRGQSLAPSLFPFLAVLVCTLGTLILLLALVAQNATESAEQEAREVASTEPEEAPTPRLSAKIVDTLLEEEKFRVDRLVAIRDQQTADIENRRDQLTHLEDHMSRLREKLKAISEEVDRATGTVESLEIDDTALSELKQRVSEEQETVDELREDAADQSPRVVIVPHKGPNGTDRRPIYLECTAEGITIWPEGSKVTMAELDAAAYSANPLDAALRAIRLHAMQNYGDPISPYPLLIVRSDGIETYGAARRAMRDWDDQFGYELVPNSVKLGYGESDAELKRRVDVAIRTAARQQTAQGRIATGPFGGGSGGRSSIGSGVRSGRRRLPELSAAQLDKQGRSGGFGPLRESRSLAGSGIGRQSGAGNADLYNRRNIGSLASPNPYGAGGSSSMVDEAAQSARRWAQQMESAAGEMRESGNPLGGRDYASNQPYGSGQASATGDASMRDRGSEFDGTPTQGFGESQSSGESATTNNSENRNSAALAGERNLAKPEDRMNLQSPANSAFSSSQNGNSNTFSSSRGSGQRAASPSMSQSGSPGQAGSMPSTFSQSPQQQTRRGQPPAGEVQPNSSASPSMNASDLVKRQGQDWALPKHLLGAKGGDVVRSIRAECYPDRFVLPPSKTGSMEIFGLADGDVQSATLRLATALRDRINRWGPALPGARWQPRLEVIVHPGGETRFNQLRTIMRGSGIEVVGRPTP